VAKIQKFHLTQHGENRLIERGLSYDAAKNVVNYSQTKTQQHGPTDHGGVRWRFEKTVDGKKLTVIAEIKKFEAWIVTGWIA
jgi:hypothetical protein